MRIWIRRFAVAFIIAILLGTSAWVVFIEVVLTSFSPNVLLQLLLPVGLAILALAGWRVIVALHKWAPGASRALGSVR
ncbi:hypothetical protein CD928_11455 [Sphingopyxis sp. GW247-27LB]|nr:hypothetical protein CD928_11455 [Sphingopyxis sp. GW247-27LB]